ncbi:helix-turn-helix domain-containing protein [Candidatus Berkelbacteria bacterium]|nr:helix-turn-helix domain-containing protein [Candidatus Berkelbacteria bacterium]
MPPYLAQELYDQIKRVINKSIAIVGPYGEPILQKNDFNNIVNFQTKTVSREHDSHEVIGNDQLRAISLYDERKLLGFVIVEARAEDIQTIQIISSLAGLIVQQFLSMHKPKPDTVDLLLTRLIFRSNTLEDGELDEQMAALGYRLDVQRVAVVLELSGFWQNYLHSLGHDKQNLIAAKKRDIELSLVSFFSRNQDNIIGYIGNDRFLVLKDLSSADFNKFFSLLKSSFNEITASLKNVNIKQITVGVGTPSHSSIDLISSASEAIQALEIGKKLFGSDKVYRNEALGVLPMLTSTNLAQKKHLAEGLVAPIITDIELLTTLESFLEHNLNLTNTSEALKVHRNTVIYRLDKIKELINKDPRKFDEAMELKLAMMFQKILSD